MHKSLLLFVTLCTVCVWGSTIYPGYKIASLQQTATGYQGSLSLLGPGPYGSDIQDLSLEVFFQTQDTLRIRIFDPNNQRWEVPFVNRLPPPAAAPSTTDYKISFVNSPFGFAVTRVSSGDVIFNTTSPNFNPILFEDQYLELSTSLPSNPNIYGLGERITSFRLPVENTFTIWNKDWGTPVLLNLYGTHPFYLEMREGGIAHGVFALNSNAQDWVLQQNSLTYRTIGGIFDIFVFLGPTPASVVQQYHNVIGNPHMPPYWGLGWHQCRWGYNNISETMAVVENYAKYNIPLDTMWNDIDYMDSYRDFTNDPVRFPPSQVRQFVENLHSNGQHYIMIIDPGISIDPGYYSYDKLLESNAFIRTYGTDKPIEGKVWPGVTYFPDFFHPNATDIWYDQIVTFHENGPEFDGMWIDMNEISNFCTGQCSSEESQQSRSVGTNWDNPPYVPGGGTLDDKTINVTAQQYISVMYNTHNMYGWSEGIACQLGMEKLRGKRSMVISRSTFASSGHHNGHWLGDNNSDFVDMYRSIAGVLNMQLFGVNLVGADICGFGGDTTMELCARWMQLGSLYPFSRNHNSIGSRSQEPYAFGQPLIDISIDALNRRYTLLPYFYTLFANAHFNATTVWRPLFFEFPTDTNTYGIDWQFLVGPYLHVIPVLTENATSVVGYFPKGTWYSYYNGSALISSGQNFTLYAPLSFIPIYIREGAIIPTQQPATTTTEARTNPFGLIVGLDASGNATGDVFIDDGESLNPIDTQYYSYLTFKASAVGTGGIITSQLWNNKYNNATIPPLSTINIYGVQTAPSKVVANNAPVSWNYDPTNWSLMIYGAKINIISNFFVAWA